MQLSKLTSLASGANWYLIAIKALLLIGLAAGSYYSGKHRCEIAHEKALVVQAQKDAKTTIDNVNKRLPEVQKEDAKAVVKREDIKKTGEKLNESLKVTPASCNLTDEQLRYFQALADKTRN